MGSIVAIHVGVVVLRVVQFHDLTGNGWFKGTIVVYGSRTKSAIETGPVLMAELGTIERYVQGKSGSVALLRMKVVLARAARLVAGLAVARTAERNALVLIRLADIGSLQISRRRSVLVVVKTLRDAERHCFVVSIE